ncbi:MAG: hypothetical protein R3C60_10510 [Parvularculaceae bacterium]
MKNYLEPTMEQGCRFVMQNEAGPFVMLNLIRFRQYADYSAFPDIEPAAPISGEEAYNLYIEQTIPFLAESGGELLFDGSGGSFLIGPEDEAWHRVLLVRQSSIGSFMAFNSNQEYLKVLRHRTAAVADSRLLPLIDELIIV